MPYLKVGINSAAQVLSVGNPLITKSAAEVRNTLLYSLGADLFGYECWTTADHCFDLNQAMQLLASARSSGRLEMGPRYNEIVKKLIEYDFDCGAI